MLINFNNNLTGYKLIFLLATVFFLVVVKFNYENNQAHYFASDGKAPTISSRITLNADEKYSFTLKKVIATSERLLFSFSATEPFILFVKKGQEKPVQYIVNSDSKYCSKLGGDIYLCKLLINNDSDMTTLTFWASQKSVTIHDLHFSTLKVTHQTNLSLINYELIFYLLVLALPIIWLCHRSIVISQWIIVAVALSCLFMIQSTFTFLLLAFLFSVFKIGKSFLAEGKKKLQKLWFGFLIGLTLLFFGKYFPSIASFIFPPIGNTSLAAPLGTSYFVIRIVDTLLAQYRGTLRQICFREFLCYVIFPPTVPAGPIETLEGFRNNRLKSITFDDIAMGLSRIIIGLFKKIVIAGYLISPIIDTHFYEVSTNPLHASGAHVVLFLSLSFLYAYMDFSAYSDIAIGSGRLYGYRIMENFSWPIFAANLHMYWRSWHRSLSLWCFRNVYFPLSVSTRNVYIPLYITMALVGLWHVFGLSWYIWSVYHATGLTVLTFIQKKKWISPQNKIWFFYAKPLRILLTLVYVIAGYSFVIFNDFSVALKIFLGYWKTFITYGIKLCLHLI